MTDPLYRLVYYSRNTIDPPANTLDAEIEQILVSSRRNNADNAITGALLFNAGCFAQVLEGPLGPLEDTFERIQQDERHGSVALLALEPITGRSFPGWAMEFLGRPVQAAQRCGGTDEADGFDPARPDSAAIHAMLQRLAIEQEAEWR